MKRKTLIISVSLLMLLGGSYFLYKNLTAKNQDLAVANVETTSPAKLNNITDEKYDLTFLDEAGEEVKLSSFKGKPIVINFWASWCPPCREEMPLLSSHQADNPDTVFIYLNQTDGFRETQALAEKFITNSKLEMTSHFDKNGESALKYGLTSLPTTYFINEAGDLQSRVVGAINEPTLITSLKNIQPSAN